MSELTEKGVESAIRRALSPFFAAYGRTEVRFELNPDESVFDPVLGTTSGGVTVLEWPKACNGQCADMGLVESANIGYEVDYGELGPTAADSIEDAFLEINWGDVHQTAQVDFRRGVPISLCGSRVAVKAMYPRVVTQNPATRQPKLIVKVSMGAGSGDSAPGIAPGATRTIRYGSIAGTTDSDILAIPPWATGAILINPDANLVTVRFSQFKDPFGVNADSLISQVDLGKFVYVPIANNARFARVRNMSNVAQTIRVLYVLGIGA